jgi:AraC-like DNA-binding protein
MYRSRRPVEALRPWVTQLWQSRRNVVLHERELALPTGASSLTIRLDGEAIGIARDGVWERFQDGVLWGAQSSFVVRDTSRLGGVVGVQFEPGMAAGLLGVPAGEMVARHVAFWRRDWVLRVQEAVDPLACLEGLLLGLRPRALDAGIRWAVGEIVKRPDVVRVEALRRECGYSVRRFGEGFRDAVGLTPKQFARVRRFGLALERLARGGEELGELALDCGFYDQSHLNREFRAFAGVTPGEYRPVRADWLHHVAVERQDSLPPPSVQAASFVRQLSPT